MPPDLAVPMSRRILGGAVACAVHINFGTALTVQREAAHALESQCWNAACDTRWRLHFMSESRLEILYKIERVC